MSSAENETPPEDTAASTEAGERAEPTEVATETAPAPAEPNAEAESKAEAPVEPKAEAEPNAEAPVEPKTKPKKKKKRAAEPRPIPERPARDARGRDRPAFLLNFPADPELESLMEAFEAGNYAKVREQAPRLIERSEAADVKAAAEELLRRIEPDPLVKLLLAVTIGLFFAVVGYVYYSH